jgi:flagellar biogenesis protein FliO
LKIRRILYAATLLAAIMGLVVPVLADDLETPGAQTPDLFSAGLKTFGLLALMIGALLLILYFLRRGTANRRSLFGGTEIIRVLATKGLSPKNYIAVVEVGDKVLTLGVTSERISCLDKTLARDFHERMGQEANYPESGNFSRRLKALTGSGSVRKEE